MQWYGMILTAASHILKYPPTHTGALRKHRKLKGGMEGITRVRWLSTRGGTTFSLRLELAVGRIDTGAHPVHIPSSPDPFRFIVTLRYRLVTHI